MTRILRVAMSSVAVSAAACAHAAQPFVADTESIVIDVGQQQAAAGFRFDAWIAHMGSIAALESRNARVRVIHVVPSRLRVRAGDTIAPLVVVAVSGLDSAGTLIPNVAPLYGPFRGGGVVRPLANGRWLAARVGQANVGVRVLRIAHALSNDTALVRSLTVEVVP